MATKDTSMPHPELVPVRSGRGRRARRPWSLDLGIDLYIFPAGLPTPARPDED